MLGNFVAIGCQANLVWHTKVRYTKCFHLDPKLAMTNSQLPFAMTYIWHVVTYLPKNTFQSITVAVIRGRVPCQERKMTLFTIARLVMSHVSEEDRTRHHSDQHVDVPAGEYSHHTYRRSLPTFLFPLYTCNALFSVQP